MPKKPILDPDSPRSKVQQIAARKVAVEQIKLLLAAGPATIGDIFQAVPGLRSTVVGYLRYMHQGERTARPTGDTRGRSTLWELGADPKLPTQDEKLDRVFAVKRGTGPAKQIGMQRCPLVAAIFGPATNNL